MQKESRKRKAAKLTIDSLFYIFGCALYSVALNSFVVPNNLVMGGFSGLGIILKYLTGFPIGAFVFILNIPLFILGFKFIGKEFIIRTLIVTALMSAMVDISAPYLPKFHGDTIIAALAGGVIAGIGLALVIVRGATTGGTDIIGKLVSIKYRHIQMGRVIMISDIIVICLSGIVYKNIESILYSMVMIFVSSNLIDYFIYGTKNGKMLFVITEKYQQVYERINALTGRGATIVPVIGAYTNKNHNLLIIVVRPGEISKIYNIINETDQNAFMTLIEAREIFGEGFGKNP